MQKFDSDPRCRFRTVQYSTVQYSTVQYSTVQYSIVPSLWMELVKHLPSRR